MRNFFESILLWAAFIAVLYGCGWMESHYDRDATVVDRTECEVTALDSCGYRWTFTVDEDDTLEVGTAIVLKMDTNGSDSIWDDTVLDYVLITGED